MRDSSYEDLKYSHTNSYSFAMTRISLDDHLTAVINLMVEG